MDVGIYDAELDTQIVKLPAIVSNTEESITKCFPGVTLGFNCEQCFSFYSLISFKSNLQGMLNYTYTCEGNILDPVTISFGEVFGSGAQCGQPGYFYPSCKFSLQDHEKNNKQKHQNSISVQKNEDDRNYFKFFF